MSNRNIRIASHQSNLYKNANDDSYLNSFIGKRITELPNSLAGYYPIIDESNRILSFMDLDGYIMMQGNLPGKLQYYSISDFNFDSNIEVYRFK